MRKLVALLTFLLPLPAWASDCPLDLGQGTTGLVVFSSHYMITFRPEPARIEVGAPFALVMNVCTRRGDAAELVRVEATMPEHKHGMNYSPTVVPAGNGRFRVEGMLFHMPGSWELAFDVRSGEEIERLTHDVELK